MRITYQVGADSRQTIRASASRRCVGAREGPRVIYGGQGGPRASTRSQQLLR